MKFDNISWIEPAEDQRHCTSTSQGLILNLDIIKTNKSQTKIDRYFNGIPNGTNKAAGLQRAKKISG